MPEIYTTILVKKPTRELLRKIGHKSQTYDQLINELIKIGNKNNNSVGIRGAITEQ
jgi:hypothetical protein